MSQEILSKLTRLLLRRQVQRIGVIILYLKISGTLKKSVFRKKR